MSARARSSCATVTFETPIRSTLPARAVSPSGFLPPVVQPLADTAISSRSRWAVTLPDSDEASPISASTSVPDSARWPGADRPSAYIPGDRRRSIATGTTILPSASAGRRSSPTSRASPLSPRRSRTSSAPKRASEVLTGPPQPRLPRRDRRAPSLRRRGPLLQRRRHYLLARRRRRPPRAPRAGSRCKRRSARAGQIIDAAGTDVRLGIKVAIAVGAARRFLVGDPEHPADRRPRRAPGRRPPRCAAPRRAGRGRARPFRACRRSPTAPSSREDAPPRPRRPPDRSAWSSSLLQARARASRATQTTAMSFPTTTSHAQWLLPAVYESLSSGSTASSWQSSVRPTRSSFTSAESTTTRDDLGAREARRVRALRAAHPRGLRRERCSRSLWATRAPISTACSGRR